MDFNNGVFTTLKIFGIEVWLTESIVYTWVIGAVLILFAIIVRISLSRWKEKPTGFQNVIELMVETMHSFVAGTVGEEFAYYGNWFFGVFAFVLLSNLSGLFGLRPPTADLATTAALGVVSFFIIHISGIIFSKGKYWKSYFEPNPVFFPLNAISAIAPAISLSFRLFGNILGGLIIMGIVYAMFPIWLKIGVPSVLHIYFDVFAGFLQSFIFVILSLSFIKERLPETE